MSTSIMGLMNQIREGEIVLPAIQRDFVWSEKQTASLLDSIMRGYPIGIVLMWETYNDLQYRPFQADYRSGNLHTYSDNRRRDRIRLVLDGQQRLQSLYLALMGHRDGKEVYLDVLSGEEDDEFSDERFVFEFLRPSEADERNVRSSTHSAPGEDKTSRQHWVSASDLFALGGRERTILVKRLRKNLDLTDDAELRIDQNLSRFAQVFTVNDAILKTATIDEHLPKESPERQTETDVLEIFVRINSEGTPLRRSDLIFSMLKLDWKESAEEIPVFLDSANEGNDFNLDIDFVVRCLFVVSGLGSKPDINLLRNKRNMALLQENFAQCCDAIRATIDFVQSEGRCQSSKLLGSDLTLIPLVYFVYRLPRHEIPHSEIDAMRTGLYLLALAAPFSRYGDSRVGAMIRSEDLDEDQFPVDACIEWVQYWEGVESVSDLAHSNKELALHLIQGLSGAKPKYDHNDPEVDHIFPRAELRRLKKFSEREINDLGNFWILAKTKNRNKSNRHPKDYFDGVSKRQLDAALIDPQMLRSYRSYRRFLKQRNAKITEKLEKKLGLADADLAWDEAELDEEV